MIQTLSRVNAWFEDSCEGAGHTLEILGRTIVQMGQVHRKSDAITSQMFRAVFGSLTIVFLTSLFSGMILALQSGTQLQKYGQEASIGYLVPAAMCMEMGPVMTAIALAGLVGSTYAAELGTMKVSEELDALEVMSIDPVYFLVMPRVIALACAAVALTACADVVGSFGGAMVGKAYLGVEFNRYFRNAEEVLDLKDIYGGLFKAFTFGVTITMIACSQGMRAGHGAEGVGVATMRTVVYSFIYILMFDYLISWAIY